MKIIQVLIDGRFVTVTIRKIGHVWQIVSVRG